MAEILQTDSREKFDAVVKEAVELLHSGEAVALQLALGSLPTRF